MTQSDIRCEVYAVLQNMDIPQKALTDRASFQKDLGLDSLDFAEMILEFEIRFDIEIPFSEVENIMTIAEAIDYVSFSIHKKKVIT